MSSPSQEGSSPSGGLVSTVRSSRRIAGDATSTALLLSGPSALDLWPGLRRVHDAPGHYAALGPVGDDPVGPVVVRADPPRRTATAYVTRFFVVGDQLPEASGELRVHGSWAGDQPGASVEVSLTSDGWDLALERQMSTAVEGFLDNLARVSDSYSGTVATI